MSRWSLCLLAVLLAVLAASGGAPLPADEPLPTSGVQPWEIEIDKALDRQVSWDFKETPLTDVAGQLQSQLKIPVMLDTKSLCDASIATDTPVTASVSGISARSAIGLILRDLNLTMALRCEVLMITTPEEAEAELTTRVYDVLDLVCDPAYPGVEPDFDSLMEVVTSMLRPTSWCDVGGAGEVQELCIGGIYALAVSQTFEVHGEIARLFASLRAVRHGERKQIAPAAVAPPGGGQDSNADRIKGLTPAQQQIRQALGKHIKLQFTNVSIKEVATDLQRRTSVHFAVDQKAVTVDERPVVEMPAVGISDKTDDPFDKYADEAKRDGGPKVYGRFSIDLPDCELNHGLSLMLEQLGLDWAVTAESVLITSREEAESCLTTRVFDVSDLPSYRDSSGRAVTDFDQLIKMITSAVSPTTWDEVGGPGAIKPFDSAGQQALVVSQAWQTQEKIADLLNKIRQARGGPLTKEQIAALPPVPQFTGDREDAAAEARAMLPLQPDPKRDALVQSVNQFATDLYGKLRTGQEGNIFFSPYSIATTLGMIEAGARGETAAEIAKTLRLSLPADQLPAAFQSLAVALPGKPTPRFELSVANRLWCQQGFRFNSEFLGTLRQNYNCEPGVADFGQPEAVRIQINAWIAEKTNNRIMQLLWPGQINADNRFVAADAIYFHGAWAAKFQKALTRRHRFYTPHDSRNVPMMTQIGSFPYLQTDDVQVLSLPYGRSAAMLALLPGNNKESLERMEFSLTAEQVQKWIDGLHPTDIQVSVPRFQFHPNTELKPTLRSLGMLSAFEKDKADFSGMSRESGPLWLDTVMHGAYLKVDENGTVAAAATAGMGTFGGPDPELPEFRADHPFVLLIYDRRTKAILFMGRVTDPNEEVSAAPRVPPGTGMF